VLAIVKSVSPSALIENPGNRRHPLIAPLLGFAFPAESSLPRRHRGGRRRRKRKRLHEAVKAVNAFF
jgi:hypothetical protein